MLITVQHTPNDSQSSIVHPVIQSMNSITVLFAITAVTVAAVDNDVNHPPPNEAHLETCAIDNNFTAADMALFQQAVQLIFFIERDDLTADQLDTVERVARLAARQNFRSYIWCISDVLGILQADGQLDVGALVRMVEAHGADGRIVLEKLKVTAERAL